MTEKRESINLNEIVALQLQCANEECRVKTILEPQSWNKLPIKCPSCGQLWWEQKTAANSDSAENMVRDLQKSIKRLIELQANREKIVDPVYRLGCNVRLEIEPTD